MHVTYGVSVLIGTDTIAVPVGDVTPCVLISTDTMAVPVGDTIPCGRY